MNLPWYAVGLLRRGQRGMALLAVLWIVAALSIIATGTVRTIRAESRSILQARQLVEAEALGDGAIQIVLQTLVAGNQPLAKLSWTEIEYRGVTMQVQSMPLTGLVDINKAGLPLLARLLVFAGGLSPEAAQATAQAIVKAREHRDTGGGLRRFEAEEDLLRVPEVDYDLYARLESLLTADLQGSGRVNPLAAPVEVLVVLAGGDSALAAQIAGARDAGQAGVDTSALDGGLLDASTSRRIRVQARVPLADGGFVRVSRSVDLNARLSTGAPWHTFRMTVRRERRNS